MQNLKYETIDESELTEDTTLSLSISYEEAKTEEKENDNGEKEAVEVSPDKGTSSRS